MASAGGGAAPLDTALAAALTSACASLSPLGYSFFSESLTSANCSFSVCMRCISPPATAAQLSLAATTRFLAWAIRAGSKRPSWLAR